MLLKKLFLSIFAVYMLSACHDIEEYDNNARGNFEALWTVVDQHYCFFKEKGVDWDEVHSRYAAMVRSDMSSSDLFNLCAQMLEELRDGHTNLSSPFATSYYRKWWTDYPQNYNDRVIEQYYFNYSYRSLGSVNYGILPQNIGYIYYGSFSTGLGAGNIDYILSYLKDCQALIIDVRDNGGGELTNVEPLVCRFINERLLAGYIIHKTGPGHDDFDTPYAYYIDPVGAGHLSWNKPVVVLANRSTFSAANNFVSIMKLMPSVKIIGSTTGGGCGMPFSSEIPCGWGIRFSACPILDSKGNLTEFGVDPTPGFEVNITPEQTAMGVDPILDKAIEYLQ